MYKDFDITKTKLIIWDLDDTFWDGTLSEGGITFKEDNLKLVEELTTKGIMNSICSKNDLLSVKSEFIMNAIPSLDEFLYHFIIDTTDGSASGGDI